MCIVLCIMLYYMILNYVILVHIIVASLGRGDATVWNPHRAQIVQFELFEFILLSELDKQFPVEQFEPTASQSTVPSPPSYHFNVKGQETLQRHRAACRQCLCRPSCLSGSLCFYLPFICVWHNVVLNGYVIWYVSNQPKQHLLKQHQ